MKIILAFAACLALTACVTDGTYNTSERHDGSGESQMDRAFKPKGR